MEFSDWVTVPKSIIEQNSLGNKRVLVYAAILFTNQYPINPLKLTKDLSLSTTRNPGGSYQQVKAISSLLVSEAYIANTDRGMVYIKKHEPYSRIYKAEFERLLSYRKEQLSSGNRINHSDALLVLAFIRMSMVHDVGHPSFYSDQLSRIGSSIGLSTRRVSTAVSLLEELKILSKRTTPSYTDRNGSWHSGVTIFVETVDHGFRAGYNAEHELERSEAIVLARSKKGRCLI